MRAKANSSASSAYAPDDSDGNELVSQPELRLAQLHLYVDNHKHERVLSPLLAIITALILTHWLSPWITGAWAMLSIVITSYSLSAYDDFKCSNADASEVGFWERKIAFAHVLHMLNWSALTIWAWQPGDSGNHMLIGVLMSGLLCLTTVMSTPSWRLYLIDMCPAVIAIVGRPLLEGDTLHFLMASLAGCFSLLLGLAGFQMYRNLLRMLQLQEENRQLIGRLENMATLDPLTDVMNRRSFIDSANHEMARCERYHHAVSLMMLDVDHFKSINDQYGHAMGDLVLKQVAQMLKECSRRFDLIGRMGGEEFVFLLPETTKEQAAYTAERIRMSIARAQFQFDGRTTTATISIGVTENTQNHADLDRLLHNADIQLYKAKQLGRNRVEVE